MPPLDNIERAGGAGSSFPSIRHQKDDPIELKGAFASFCRWSLRPAGLRASSAGAFREKILPLRFRLLARLERNFVPFTAPKKAPLLGAFFGAGGRARTDTGFIPRDFKSLASANSTTPARYAVLFFYNFLCSDCPHPSPSAPPSPNKLGKG